MLGGVLLHLMESHGHEHHHRATEHEHAHSHDDGHHDPPLTGFRRDRTATRIGTSR